MQCNVVAFIFFCNSFIWIWCFVLDNAQLFFFISEFFRKIIHYAKEYGTRYRIKLGYEYFILVSNPEDIEAILTSNKILEKSRDYYLFEKWLGDGLLISHGQKWHARRKLLTHAFHFKILDDFVRVFDTQGDVLVQQLKQHVNGKEFDICPFVTLYTLDVICGMIRVLYKALCISLF